MKIAEPQGASTVYTNGSVKIQVDVLGGSPEKVELLSDGVPFIELRAPYVYSWDTRGLNEGERTVIARAQIGEMIYASSPITVVIDRTPPSIVRMTPTPGDDNVWVKAPIEVEFSKPLNPATVNDDSVTVSGSNDVALGKELSLSQDGRRLSISLTSTPELPNTIVVALQGAIADFAGSSLLPSGKWSFTMPSWWHPWPLPVNSKVVYGFDFVLDSAARPIVVWAEPDGDARALRVARWSGTSWQPVGSAIRLVASVTSLSIALDVNNDPVVAWEERTSDLSDPTHWIFVTRLIDGDWKSPWGTPLSSVQAVLTASGRFPMTPIVVTEPNGSLFVVAAYPVSGTPCAVVKMWDAQSGSWSDPQLLNIDATKIAIIQSAILGPAGDLYVAWIEGQDKPGGYKGDLWVKRWSLGKWTQIGGEKALNAVGRVATYAVVRVTREGVPVVVWIDHVLNGSSAEYAVRLAKPTVAGWLINWPDANGEMRGMITGISMALDSMDVPTVAYSQGDIKVRRFINGSWSSVGSSPQRTGTSIGWPKLAIGKVDLPYLGFSQSATLAPEWQAMVTQLNR